MKSPLLNSSGTRMVATVGAIALAVLGVSTWVMFSTNKPQVAETPSSEAEKKKEDQAAIGALGRLEPAGEVHTIAAPAGGFSSRVLGLGVKEGDLVKQGQPIAQMDNYATLQAIVFQYKAQYDEAVARLAQSTAGAEDDINAQIASTESQNAAINQSRADGRSVSAAQRSSVVAISTAEADVETRTAELSKAQKLMEAYKQLGKEGAFSKIQVQQSISDEKIAVQRLAQSQQALEQAKQSKIQQDAKLDQAIATVDQARGKTSESFFKQKSIEKTRPADIQQAKAQVAVAEANLKKAMVDRDNAVITSPIDGKVLKINAKAGEAVGSNGIMNIGFTDKMFVVAEVDENSISRVRKGDRAIIKSDAFKGELSGKVELIGAQVRKNGVTSADPSDKQDVRVVEVKILLDDSSIVKNFTNLQVKVSIQP